MAVGTVELADLCLPPAPFRLSPSPSPFLPLPPCRCLGEGRAKRRRFVRPKLEWPWAQKLAYLYLSAAPTTFPGNDQSGSAKVPVTAPSLPCPVRSSPSLRHFRVDFRTGARTMNALQDLAGRRLEAGAGPAQDVARHDLARNASF